MYVGRVWGGALYWTCIGPGDQTGRPYIAA